jgi:hypothetical protein
MTPAWGAMFHFEWQRRGEATRHDMNPDFVGLKNLTIDGVGEGNSGHCRFCGLSPSAIQSIDHGLHG